MLYHQIYIFKVVIFVVRIRRKDNTNRCLNSFILKTFKKIAFADNLSFRGMPTFGFQAECSLRSSVMII